MKKKIKIFLLLILMPFALIGQKRVPLEINKLKKLNSKFEKIAVLTENKASSDKNYKKVVKEATLATLNLNEVEQIIKNKNQTIEIQIPYKNELLTIELYKVDIFSEGFKINSNVSENVTYTKGAHYRGIIKGDENSIAAFNFFENEMNGIVSSLNLGNLNIGKLTNSSEYIIYSDLDLNVKNEFICHTKDEPKINNDNTLSLKNDLIAVKCVTTYIEVGYQAYQANGNSITTTTNWITSIFNNSQTLFDNDGISIALKTVFIWTTDDYFSTSSSLILPAFHNARPYFDGDIGFIADIDPSSLGGQAFSIGGLCTDRKFAYGDLVIDYETIPTFSQPVSVITHELGHVLGSHHTHACVWNGDNTAIDGCAESYGGCSTPFTPPNTPGTIMSYCFPYFSLGFGTQPANAIMQHVASSQCLGADCVNSCINSIGNIQVLNTTQTSANVQWTDNNATNTSWQISVVPYGNAPVWVATSSTSYSLTGLIPNTHYDIIIKGNCPSNYSYPKHSRIFATQGDNCAGTIIYDTGGATAGYSGDEHIIRTIVPTVPNKKIKLTFNNLNTVQWDSFLFVYDGLDNNGPLLNYLTDGYPFLAFSFGNTFEPFGNVFESQDPSGALTLEFFSRPYYFNENFNNGWKATVSCLNSLGNEEIGDGFIDYSYSPNPIKDILTIKSKDIIKEVKIFSIEGKLVLTKTFTDANISIDLSTLASGNYITKLFFNDINATTFKIIKQ